MMNTQYLDPSFAKDRESRGLSSNISHIPNYTRGENATPAQAQEAFNNVRLALEYWLRCSHYLSIVSSISMYDLLIL